MGTYLRSAGRYDRNGSTLFLRLVVSLPAAPKCAFPRRGAPRSPQRGAFCVSYVERRTGVTTYTHRSCRLLQYLEALDKSSPATCKTKQAERFRHARARLV